MEQYDEETIIKKPRLNKKARTKKKVETTEEEKKARMLKTSNTHKMKRAFSESKVLDLVDLEDFKENDSLHFISRGDVDSFSYLKAMSRKQKLKYVLISTWCIGRRDIEDIKEMIENGKIEKLDVYGGEILPSTYKNEFLMLKEVVENNNGRMCIFRNHSKVCVGLGEKFDFAIESSANVNTNPRTEQTTITISKELAKFYKAFYDGIKSFI